MKIESYQINGSRITEIISDDVLIKVTQDALDIMADSTYNGHGRINFVSSLDEAKERLAR